MKTKVYHFYILMVTTVLSLLVLGCGASTSEIKEDDTAKTKPKHESIDLTPTANVIQIFTEGNPIGWDKKAACRIQIGDNIAIHDARIKFRGGASSKYHKHSFSFSLKNDTLLDSKFHLDNDFILNANYIDKTFFRHRLCYDVFSGLDSRNITSQCLFQEVYLDGDYQGVYVLMEEIDRSKCNLSKKDTTALLIKDGIMFVEDTTGFYIQPGEDAFQQKFPKQQTAAHLNRLSQLRNFIHNSDDQVFIDSVEYYFDLKNVASWHELLLLSNNGDGVVKNFYWYTQNNGPWKVIPWDYDDSFGRNGDGTLQTQDCGWERNILLKRLFDLSPNDYRKLLIEKMKNFVILNASDNTLQQYITTIKATELLTGAFDRNFKKWKINDANYSDSLNMEEEIELLEKKWFEQINYLDSLSRIWEIQ